MNLPNTRELMLYEEKEEKRSMFCYPARSYELTMYRVLTEEDSQQVISAVSCTSASRGRVNVTTHSSEQEPESGELARERFP